MDIMGHQVRHGYKGVIRGHLDQHGRPLKQLELSKVLQLVLRAATDVNPFCCAINNKKFIIFINNNIIIIVFKANGKYVLHATPCEMLC